jgi:DNA-binding CsgD family transcriptional regulator
MARCAVNLKRLQAVGARLGDAAVNPAIWPEIMEQVCAAAGATGAALLQSDLRTPDIPRTAGVDGLIRSYFADGWHMRDIRAQRGVPLLLQGQKVIIDQDIVTPDEMRRDGLYTESLIPHGLQWFAVVGFWAGPALWGLSIQRTPDEGAFDLHDKRLLADLSQQLTEAATLSQTVGRAVLIGLTNGLGLIKQPALALDRSGFVLETNPAAAQLFDDEFCIRNRRLRVRDKRASFSLDRFIDQMRITPDTAALACPSLAVQRSGKRPLVIRFLPVGGAARTPFLGARVLLVLSDLDVPRQPDSSTIARAFSLSPAETRLAALIARGLSPRQAADELGVAHETARAVLKAVFAKTGTHRQSELVALLARLSRFNNHADD